MDRVARGGRPVGVPAGSFAGGHPFAVVEVLDAEWDSGERAQRAVVGDVVVDAGRLVEGAVGVEVDERVERAVALVDGPQ